MDLHLYVLYGVMAILFAVSTVIYFKKLKDIDETKSLNAITMNYLSDIVRVAQVTIKIMQSGRGRYGSDKEWWADVALAAAEEIRYFLKNKSDMPNTMVDKVSNENLINVSWAAINMAKEKLGVEEAVEPVQDKVSEEDDQLDKPPEKVDISAHLNIHE